MSSLLVLNSNTGNTRTFLDFIVKHSTQKIEVCEDFSSSVKDFDKIAFGTYTWKNGKIPDKMKNYLIENHRSLQGKEVFVFGSGNSVYQNFCGAVDGVRKICEVSSADIKGTFKFEQRFNENDFSKTEIEKLILAIRDWSE
jgi:flavodoxin I